MDIILASKSPRRRELLAMMGIRHYSVQPAQRKEFAPPGLPPRETVEYLARQKVFEVSSLNPHSLVIAADTLVFLEEHSLGKPGDSAEAVEMLRTLSGKKHTVCTGVSIKLGDHTVTESESTAVYFRNLSEKEILAYVASGEPMDKAGAYGAQSMGAMLIDHIDGDFFNVMGLPVRRLYLMLKQFGMDLLG